MKTRLILIAGLIGASLSAQANVALRNGNFFVAYRDLSWIERVYNSKTPFRGIWGWGWGADIESYLVVSADGSVVAYEYGGGAENRFNPLNFSKSELENAATMLTEAAKKSGVVTSRAEDYKKKLIEDATFRNDEWKKFLKKGIVKRRELAPGTKLVSNRFAYQYITREKNGYVRVHDSGKVEYFDNDGHLVKMQDQNGNFKSFTYDKAGHLNKMIDNHNRKCFFSFDNKGLVEKIQCENNQVATYKYNGLAELVESKDGAGNVYKYKYTSDKRHNLAQIAYADKTTMDIEYYGKNLFENVKRVKERDGSAVEYGYEMNANDRSKQKVSVKSKDKGGRILSDSSYEYHFRTKADGEEWTYRLVAVVDGEKTETTYNECCGLPLTIRQGNEETAFEYDQKGHVTKKTTPAEIAMLEYHPQFGKVTKVSRYSKEDKSKGRWSEFKYDDKGNLTFAKNSDKKGVQLIYNRQGQIASLIDQSRRRIDFKYNELNKPVEIRDPKLGAIKVTYDNSGAVKSVDSSGDRRIASEVTSAFQSLMEIIRPAGVTLSF